MATYPTSPRPNDTGLPAAFDPALESRFDGGSISTRSKYLTERSIIVLSYTTYLTEYRIFEDFRRQVRGRALTFDFTYPWGETIQEVKDTTPVGLVTQANHGFATGQQVTLTNVNPSIDGVHTITVTGLDSFSLNGTTASGTANNGGNAARYFPKMRLVVTGNTMPAPTKLSGPPTNNEAIVQYIMTLEEDF